MPMSVLVSKSNSCKHCVGTVLPCQGVACGGSLICAYTSYQPTSQAIKNAVEIEAQMDSVSKRWGLKSALGLDFTEELEASKSMVEEVKDVLHDVKESLDAGVKVKVGGSDAFEKLAETVEGLAKNGVDVNVKDSTGIAGILTKILDAITSGTAYVKDSILAVLKSLGSLGGGFLGRILDIFSLKTILETEFDESRRIIGLLTIFAIGYIQLKHITNVNIKLITTALMWTVVWLTGMDPFMITALIGWTGGTLLNFVKEWYDYWTVPSLEEAVRVSMVNGESVPYNYFNMLVAHYGKYSKDVDPTILTKENREIFDKGMEETLKRQSEVWEQYDINIENEEEVEETSRFKKAVNLAMQKAKAVGSYLVSGEAWTDIKKYSIFIYESICNFIASLMENPRDYINMENIKNFLKSCKLLQEIRNGASFTVSTICEMVIEILNALGSPLGLTLFKKTYTKFPELYDIGDEMNRLSELIHKGKPVNFRQAENFSSQKARLEAVKKRIPMNKEYAMYHRQAELITQLATKIEHTLFTHGVYSGNFRAKPFVATFLGQSQIGKTQIIDLVERFLAPYVVGHDRMADYEKNRADFTYCWKNREFQDTYRSGTKIIRIDDWAQIKQATGPENCPGQLMIDLVNNEPHPINMAEAHRKNTVSAEHSLQLISTNLIKWNADRFYVLESQAVKNRLGTKFMVHLYEQYREYVDIKKEKYKLKLCTCFREGCTEIHARKFDPKVYYFEEWEYQDESEYGAQAKKVRSYDFEQMCKLLAKQYLDHMDTEAQKINAYNRAAKDRSLNPLLGDDGKPLNEYQIRDLPDPAAEPMRSGASTPIMVAANGDEAREIQIEMEKIRDSCIPAAEKDMMFKFYNTKLQYLQMMKLEKGLEEAKVKKFNLTKVQWFKQLLDGTLTPEAKTQFPGRPSELLSYLLPCTQIRYASVMYEDEAWCEFMVTNYLELCEWGKESTYGSLLAETVRCFKKEFDPREIYPQAKTIVLYFFSLYNKMKEFFFRLNMTYHLIWASFKNLPFKEAMASSYDTLKTWVCIETRKSVSNFVSAFTLFSFTGAWVKAAVVIIPSLVIAYRAMEKGVEEIEVEAQGDYVKKAQIKKIKAKKVKVNKINIPKGEAVIHVEEAPIEVNRNSDVSRPIDRLVSLTEAVDKHNKYSMMLVQSDGTVVNNLAICLFLREQIGITNAHVIKCVSVLKHREIPMMVRFTNVGTRQTFDVSVMDIECAYDHSRDIAVFQCARLSAMPPRRNITNLFLPAGLDLPTPGKAYLNYAKMQCDISDEACVPKNLVRTLQEVDMFEDRGTYYYKGSLKAMALDLDEMEKEIFGEDTYMFQPKTLIHYRMRGVAGMCTSELWVPVKGNLYIAGIHNGAKEDHSFCVRLTREYIVAMVAKFKRKLLADVPLIPVEIMACSAIPRQFMPIRLAPKIAKPTKSGIRRTRIHGLFGVSKIPTQLSPFEYKGEEFDPEGMARAKYSPNRGPINSHIYELATDAYIKKVIRNLPGITEDKVLSLDEVVHGYGSLEGIPRNTSVGPVYAAEGMTKASIFGTEERRNLNSVHGQKFERDFYEALSKLYKGETPEFITSEFGKAECLPEEKVLKGKLRLISNPELLNFAVAKALFGHAMNLFLNNPMATDTMIGVNPYSRQWHEFYMKLRGFLAIAGDVKNFDAEFASWGWIACYLVIEAMYPHSTPEERLARWTFIYGSINSVHRALFEEFSVDYMWESCMSSGLFLTILFNSIKNNIDLRYVVFCIWVEAFLKMPHMEYHVSKNIPAIPVVDILANMVFVTLGDDHIVGAKGWVLDWISHKRFSDIYARAGIQYTDEAKRVGCDVPLRSLNEIEMCKRTWRWDHTLMRYVGPLNLASIHESLNWTENNDTLTEQVIDTAIGEYALHGVEVWDQFAPTLIQASITRYNHYPKWTTYKQALRGITSEVAQWDPEEYEPCQLRLVCVETNPGPVSIVLMTNESGKQYIKLVSDDSTIYRLVSKALKPVEKLPIPEEDYYIPERDHEKYRLFLNGVFKVYKAEVRMIESGGKSNYLVTWDAFRIILRGHLENIFDYYNLYPQTPEYEIIGGYVDEHEGRATCYQYTPDRTTIAMQQTKELKSFLVARDLLRGAKMVIRYRRPEEVKIVTPLSEEVKEDDDDGGAGLDEAIAAQLEPKQIEPQCDRVRPIRIFAQSDDAQPIKEVIETTEFVNDAEVINSNFNTTTQGGSKSSDMVSISSFLHRPQLMSTLAWSNTHLENTVLYSIDVNTALLSNSWWKNKIQGFGLWRATACLKVVLNASPFMAGKLITTFLPSNAVEHAKTYNCHLCLKTQQPNVIIDASQSSSVLEIPFVSPYHYFDMNNTAIGTFGTFYLSVLSPLAVDPAGMTSADVAIYLYFQDVEVCQPIMPQSDKPRRISRRTMGVDDSEKERLAMEGDRSISSALMATSNAAASLSSIPVISSYMGPVSWALRAASTSAASFGWAKPSTNTSTTVVAKQSNRFMGVSDGEDVSLPLGLANDNSVRILDNVSIRSEDEMSFSFLKQVYAFLRAIPWVVGAKPTTFVSIPISPKSLYTGGSTVVGTKTAMWSVGPPIWYLCSGFQYWRGSIKLKFIIVKTKFHTGRLEFVFTPGTTLSSGVTVYSSTYSLREIIDIRNSDEIELTLPYLLPMDYLDLTQLSGTLTINVLTSLRAPPSVAQNVSILMFASGGSDFELAAPIGGTLNLPIPFTPQGDNVRNMDGILTSTVIGGRETDQRASTNPADSCMGEIFTSIRQLLSRASTMRANNVAYKSSMSSLSVYPWYFSGLNLDASGMVVPNWGGDTLSFMAPLFNFFRGSMRIHMWNDGGTTVPERPQVVSLANNAYWPTSAQPVDVGSLYNAYNNLGGPWWTTAAGNGSTNPFGFTSIAVNDYGTGSVHVRVPYYNCTRVSNVKLSAVSNVIGDATTPDVRVVFSGHGNYYTAQIARSIGDDFQFSYFLSTVPLLDSWN